MALDPVPVPVQLVLVPVPQETVPVSLNPVPAPPNPFPVPPDAQPLTGGVRVIGALAVSGSSSAGVFPASVSHICAWQFNVVSVRCAEI